MMKRSAGILPYRRSSNGLQVLLVHAGGPSWQSRDLGAWSIAKGEYDDSELPEAAARREFQEETGWEPKGALLNLGELCQRKSKILLSRWKAISIPPRCAATCLRWNGHDAAAACSHFPRWIAVHGWIWTWPGQTCLPANGPF